MFSLTTHTFFYIIILAYLLDAADFERINVF